MCTNTCTGRGVQFVRDCRQVFVLRIGTPSSRFKNNFSKQPQTEPFHKEKDLYLNINEKLFARINANTWATKNGGTYLFYFGVRALWWECVNASRPPPNTLWRNLLSMVQFQVLYTPYGMGQTAQRHVRYEPLHNSLAYRLKIVLARIVVG